MLSLASALDVKPSAVVYGANWETKYKPKLIKTADGKVVVDTALTRLVCLQHLRCHDTASSSTHRHCQHTRVPSMCTASGHTLIHPFRLESRQSS